MKNGLKREIRIYCDKSEKMDVGEKIHNQLVGNQDYVDCNIILNCDRPDLDYVTVLIFEECENIPEITI